MSHRDTSGCTRDRASRGISGRDSRDTSERASGQASGGSQRAGAQWSAPVTVRKRIMPEGTPGINETPADT